MFCLKRARDQEPLGLRLGPQRDAEPVFIQTLVMP